METHTSKLRTALITGTLLVFAAGLCGCDDFGFGGMTDSLLGGWDTGYGYDYGYGYDWGYPDYGLYDPTDTIQSVVDYRSSVMESSANAWDAYIRQ